MFDLANYTPEQLDALVAQANVMRTYRKQAEALLVHLSRVPDDVLKLAGVSIAGKATTSLQPHIPTTDPNTPNHLYIRYGGGKGKLYRTYDLNLFTVDQIRTLKAYKMLFERGGYNHQQIVLMARFGNNKASATGCTLFHWQADRIARRYSYEQFRKNIAMHIESTAVHLVVEMDRVAQS